MPLFRSPRRDSRRNSISSKKYFSSCPPVTRGGAPHHKGSNSLPVKYYQHANRCLLRPLLWRVFFSATINEDAISSITMRINPCAYHLQLASARHTPLGTSQTTTTNPAFTGLQPAQPYRHGTSATSRALLVCPIHYRGIMYGHTNRRCIFFDTRDLSGLVSWMRILLLVLVL